MSDVKINYVVGDATEPIGDDVRIIAHICNDKGGWGAGFVLAISAKWKDPEASYRNWHRVGKGFQLGKIELVQVEPHIFVANMIAQTLGRGPNGEPPIRYDALADCLSHLASRALIYNASVHMPRIGAGLAGGDWNVIEQIIEERVTSKGVSVTVYDLPQR